MSYSPVEGKRNLRSFFTLLEEDLRGQFGKTESIDYAIRRQLHRARKRAQLGESSLLRSVALEQFLLVNDEVGSFKLDLTKQETCDARSFITKALENYTSSKVDCFQTSLDLDLVFDLWRFGPGASNGVRGTHTAEKIAQPMSSTRVAASLVSELRCATDPIQAFDCLNGCGVRLVEGSRLTTVPKNEETERTIAIEPSGNMALQLGASMYLDGALRRLGLDISTQQAKNKLAAQIGSIDGSLATLDLSAASDRISLPLARALLPKDWFDLLVTIRSPKTELPDGTGVTLRMLSTMGNGTTFPIMTLLIVALIYAYRAGRGGPNLFVDWSSTCVFGDDIIVPTEEATDVIDILERAGFVVNHDKSYLSGPFRESCGGDYYKGYDVTPFYVKSLTRVPEVYVAINQVLEWCAKHGLHAYRTLEFLIGLLRRRPYLVPEWENPDSGILTPFGPARYRILRPKVRRKKLRGKSLFFASSLAAGGYVEQIGDSLFFVPRCANTQYETVKLRRPKGYLSGWDPLKRSQLVSSRIGTQVSILLHS